MLIQNEIDNVATFVSSAKNAIADKSSGYQRTAELKHFKGDVSNALKNANLHIKNKSSNLQSAYDALNSKLTGLSFAVDRAEKLVSDKRTFV